MAPFEVAGAFVECAQARPAPGGHGGERQEQGSVTRAGHPTQGQGNPSWSAVPVPGGGPVLWVAWLPRGIVSIRLPGAPSPDGVEGGPLPEAWRDVLQAYFAGDEDADPATLPFAGEGSRFQRRVWRALRAVPKGDLVTYGEVARACGVPGAARAVGRAAASNPAPLVVPCHRLVAGGGRLGGFSAGLAWKRRLLRIEGVRVDSDRVLPGQLDLW